MKLFGNCYAGRRVLVTGHTGFKGSWLVLWLRSMGADVAGLALDPDTVPSHWNLLGLDDVANHRVDLRDTNAVHRVVNEHRPEIVFHLAAQPLVRRSYLDPVTTFETNVMGTVNLLQAVRNCSSIQVAVIATTDKVYAEHNEPQGYKESDPLGGHDPYSSSKACTELISHSYQKSYFSQSHTSLATARAGNVIGGGDWAEDRLVPDLIRAALSHKKLSIRNPDAIRPWQHVLEPLSGYLLLAQRLWEEPALAGAWNFGPGSNGEVTVQTLVNLLTADWNPLHIECNTDHQPHEASTLRLNVEKAWQGLRWRPVWKLSTALTRTAHWYQEHHATGKIKSMDDIGAYIDDARKLGLEWAQ